MSVNPDPYLLDTCIDVYQLIIGLSSLIINNYWLRLSKRCHTSYWLNIGQTPLRCMRSHARAQAHMQVIYHMRKIIVFKFLFCYYYIFQARRYFSLKDFSLKIIYRKFKIMLIVKYFRKKIHYLLASSDKPLLIITWYGHTFMFAL